MGGAGTRPGRRSLTHDLAGASAVDQCVVGGRGGQEAGGDGGRETLPPRLTNSSTQPLQRAPQHSALGRFATAACAVDRLPISELARRRLASTHAAHTRFHPGAQTHRSGLHCWCPQMSGGAWQALCTPQQLLQEGVAFAIELLALPKWARESGEQLGTTTGGAAQSSHALIALRALVIV